MKPRTVLITLGSCVVLGLCVHVARGMSASSAVDREIAALQQQLGPRDVQPSAPTKRLANRAELVRLLDWVAELGPSERLRRSPAQYWAPDAPAAYRDELRARLELHKPFFDGLDQLPPELWEDRFALPEGEADRPERWGSWATTSATNVLCARAWLVAQEPGGSALAGHSLGLALAIARVTDDGLFSSLSVREFVEQRVLDALERTRAVAVAPTDELYAPVRAELQRSLAEDRSRMCVATEAWRFLDHLRAARASGIPGWLAAGDDTEAAVAYLASYRELLRWRAESASTAADEEHCVYPPRGEDPPNRLWRMVTALDYRRRNDLQAALKAI